MEIEKPSSQSQKVVSIVKSYCFDLTLMQMVMVCRQALVLAPRPHRPLVAAMEHEALQDLLSWLLDGAMQRAPPGGTVYVSAESVDAGVAITITDTGELQFVHLLTQPQLFCQHTGNVSLSTLSALAQRMRSMLAASLRHHYN